MRYVCSHGARAVNFIIILLALIFSPVSVIRGEDGGNIRKPLSSAELAETAQAQPIHEAVSAYYPDALKIIKKMIEVGKYKEALDILSPFISEPMSQPNAVADYIAILVWDGRLDDAINMYEKLPASFPQYGYLLRNIAKAYYDKKEFSKSFLLYRAALEQSPSDKEARKGVVFSLIQTGDFDRASDYIEKYLTNAPDSLSLAVAEDYLLFWRERYTEAFEIYHMLAQRNDIGRENLYKSRYDLIASLPLEKRRAMATYLSNAARKFTNNFILVLILNKDYETAVRAFEASKLDINQYPYHLLEWIAWSYFKTDDTRKAKFYYKKLLGDRPDYVRANIGLAYCLAKEGQGNEAIDIVDNLLMDEPGNVEIMFARAYAFEQSKRFWSAVQEYDRILKISRKNLAAGRQRLLALSDLGSSSHAFEKANKNFPHDLKLLDSIMGDIAADRINWKKYPDAIGMLQSQLQDNENLRAGYDYIAALVGNKDMKEAVEVYEELVENGISPPIWVLENVAEAYLDTEQPYKALELYDKALEAEPTFNGRIGRFYALQEIREWEKAKKALDDLDRETPAVIRRGGKTRPNWPKLETTLARGWLLLYEDRLKEAEEYFRGLNEKAPANTAFRTGIAYAYLWRGWPSKALREFRIIKTLDPKDIGVRVGEISALNTLSFRELARKEAEDMLELHPENRHVQDIVQRLKLEEMQQLAADFVISSDDDGFEEVRAETRFTQPISLYTGVHGFVFRQRSLEENQRSYFRRAGLGIDHIFNSSWRVRQQFSVNYNDAEDFGSFTQIGFTPDDYWTLNLSYDSFTTDIPMRARVFDINADKLSTALTYRESDRRSYNLSFIRQEFSDSNKRNQGLLGYEQSLYVKENWKMRLFLDLSTFTNSNDDAPYFNPDSDFSVSATHLTDHTFMRIYRKAFVHRLYLSLGAYKQSGFSTNATGSVQYEHDIDFSDKHSLLYGVNLARKAFDGEAIDGHSFYLTWRLLF